MGVKITLAEALQQERYAHLVIYCTAVPATGAGCHYSGVMSLQHAINIWGAERRLDELPLRCSRCGSRKVDVRTDYPRGPGGKAVFE